MPRFISITNQGNALYTIPIDLPPGTGGVQPQLALHYDSSGTNGILGQGWSIQGLSSIERAPTTIVHDGFIDGVDFDTNDRFLLDG